MKEIYHRGGAELEQSKRLVLLGFSSATPDQPLGLQRVDISKGVANMHGLYVKPDARGMGIGRLLVKAGIAAAQEDNRVSLIRTIILYGNDLSLHLLEREGFTINTSRVVGIQRYGRTFGEHELIRTV